MLRTTGLEHDVPGQCISALRIPEHRQETGNQENNGGPELKAAGSQYILGQEAEGDDHQFSAHFLFSISPKKRGSYSQDGSAHLS